MLKIGIIVHGRFHAFDLARALIACGHQVNVFTNYPHWATRKFGLQDDNVRSFWAHGVACKTLERVNRIVPQNSMSRIMHTSFGHWAAEEVVRESWDVTHTFSGVGEEVLTARRHAHLRSLARGSAHILAQDRLLAEEGERIGGAIERPCPWIIEREQREYEAADLIFVLSTFAMNSFVQHGVPRQRIRLLKLGVDTTSFRASSNTIEERCMRIRAGQPLRVVFVGTFSARKGAADYVAFVRALDQRRFSFRFIGNVTPDGNHFRNSIQDRVEFIPRQPHAKLPEWYSQGDLFVFPTIEDGFAVVLAQAHANALPIITTTNCAGPDLISEGNSGWTLPIRRPDAFIERLTWCDEHREELAGMVERIHSQFMPRDWSAVAADFATICNAEMQPVS